MIVTIMAEAWQEKYWTETNKMPMANCVRYLASEANAQFMTACKSATMTDELRARIESAFNHK
jgi:hypothetical protein